MTAITSFLDNVTALTEGRPDLLRNAKVLSLNPHSIKSDGMAALLELRKFLFVALPAFFRKDHRLLL
jgi:hypothetical protein